MALRRDNRGFTLIEAMILVAIVGIVGLAAGVAMQSLAKTPSQADLPLALNAECVSRMEQMRATPFTGLSAEATALTGNVTINGKTYAAAVTVRAADADANGTNDSDFSMITVNVGSQSLIAYMVQP